jgi:NTP pyrophosphatase (non-canonical NTP hydrolase)
MTKSKTINRLTRKLNEYAQERDWVQFHSPKNLAMALSVEAAELVEIFQWLSEEESYSLSAEQRLQTEHEMADIFLYLLRIADRTNIDLIDAADKKILLNEQRYPADKVRGSSKKYTYYHQDKE